MSNFGQDIRTGESNKGYNRVNKHRWRTYGEWRFKCTKCSKTKGRSEVNNTWCKISDQMYEREKIIKDIIE